MDTTVSRGYKGDDGQEVRISGKLNGEPMSLQRDNFITHEGWNRNNFRTFFKVSNDFQVMDNIELSWNETVNWMDCTSRKTKIVKGSVKLVVGEEG